MKIRTALGQLALAVAAVVALPAADADAAPVCNTSTVAAGNYTYSISHGGRTRSYRLHVPRNLTTPAAVVLSLHGLSSSASSQQSGSGWDTTSDAQRSFVVAYPCLLYTSPSPRDS